MTSKMKSGLLLLTILFGMLIPFTQGFANTGKVYHVPLENAVEKGLLSFLERSFAEAEQAEAETIIIEINTPGGFVDAAGKIGKLFNTSELDVIAYINDDALSAGALLALYADEIYMSPRAKMGAAQVIDSSGKAADDKADSAWIASMKNAAKSSNREEVYAVAMADPVIDLPELNAGEGKLLTLTAENALAVGYTEGIVTNFDELLEKLGYSSSDVVAVNETFSEKLARFITDPVVVPILLSVAGLGLIVELYSPGFGVPGSMGLLALLLFFYGHLVAGLAGFETLILFIIGLSLVITEIFVAGGIAGVIGSVAIIGSIIMAGANPVMMAVSVLIALAIASIGMVILIKFFGKKLHLLNRMVLMDSTDTESGYVSNVNRVELVGRVGVTITPLRPSGSVELDGERLDVVSDGSFVDRGKHVTIIKVEGSRVVVRETEMKEENE